MVNYETRNTTRQRAEEDNASWQRAFNALRVAGLEANADHPIAAAYRAASDAVNHANRARDFSIATGRRYAGKTWQQVLEENEWFDGEPEITAAAKAAWREANRRPV